MADAENATAIAENNANEGETNEAGAHDSVLDGVEKATRKRYTCREKTVFCRQVDEKVASGLSFRKACKKHARTTITCLLSCLFYYLF